MSLDEQAAAWLKGLADSGLPPLNEMTVEQARVTYTAVVNDCGLAPEPVAEITDRTIPGPAGDIPIRIYTPEGLGPFPVLVYYHGGGWVIGNLEVVHGICTVLANRAGTVVVSVDYRLAPEHPFPAAVEDAHAALRWVGDNAASINGDAGRIAVGGDSAGGTLSAVVALLARTSGPDLLHQLLIYPATEVGYHTPSYHANGQDYFLTTDLMCWFHGHYRPDPDDWRASPLKAPDLSGLPSAYVITAEFDPLRDEGEAYAERLRQAGVEVTCRRYDGQIHAFTANLAGVMDEGRRSVVDAGLHLKRVFDGR
ncbi:alpha/beta hydrolase [Amycolatopsis thermoflava]|uniref:alpha/beta hydrolase n=1 Tax=Amycolatopsis thermoflava TaxID=84480 RepID=UPI003D719BA8